MKIVVTGSLGNISKPLATQLVQKGHTVTVISSKQEKAKEIQGLGALAAIGSMEDVSFLTNAFTGADTVYCMIPLNFTEQDLPDYLHRIARNYLQAIKQSGVKRVVLLSGWAANLMSGESLESVFDELTNISVTIMRPASFYSNFYSSIDLISGKGLMGALLTARFSGLGALLTGKRGVLMGNYGGDDRMVFVSTTDIANAVAEELLLTTGNGKIRYVGSEEMTCNEAAKIIGSAIGKPWLKWVRVSDKQLFRGLKAVKLPLKTAKLMVEMGAVNHSGKPLQNFNQNKPGMGKVKLADFAKEFAKVYNRSIHSDNK